MSNTTKHTLFSFVTSRAPEQLTDDQKANYYVQHPNPKTEGFFTGVMNAATTAQYQTAVTNSTAGFAAQALKTNADVKNLVGNVFYDFDNWLAKNKDSASQQPTTYVTAKFTLPAVLPAPVVLTLWDNLFYTLLTNQYSPLQEQLQQALIANHYLLYQNAVNPEMNEVALTKCAIPQELFGLANAVNNQTPTVSLVDEAPLKQALARAQAQQAIDGYNAILKDLAKAKATYNKDNKAAYTTAKADYDATVAGILANIRPTDDDQIAHSPGGEVVTTVVQPNVPTFTFEPISTPFNGNDVYDLFSTQNRGWAMGLGLNETSSFEEAADIVKQAIEEQTELLFTNASLNNTVAVVAGQVIPVDANLVPSTTQQYAYIAEIVDNTSSNAGYRIVVVLNLIGYPNASVNNVLYNSRFTNGTSNTGTAFIQNTYGNTIVMSFYPQGNFLLPAGTTSFNLDGYLVLQNGNKLTFNASVDKTRGASGIMELESAGTGTGTTAAPTTYGVKRVGIDDYRKVEQEVCCWDAGEVSHIENVMAREYKERSTRLLRRSEDTTTNEKSTESEKLSDTSSTDRFEMQQQTAKAISENTAVGITASVNYSGKVVSANLSGSYAHNTSQQQSNSQAVQFSKDITQKASEKIVNKVREERIIKIIDEYEEQNKHGFDNRAGDKHISGVYRWIDKIYKNQVFNYGKRLMYEFMVPQPAVFHTEAMKATVAQNSSIVLTKPVDPRIGANGVQMKDYTQVTDANYKYWGAMYNVELDAPKESTIFISKSFADAKTETNETFNANVDIPIPDGYITKYATIKYQTVCDNDRSQSHGFGISLGNINLSNYQMAHLVKTDNVGIPLDGYTEKITLSYSSLNHLTINIAVSINAELDKQAVTQWQVDCFNKIIKAYEAKLEEYNKSQADAVVNTTVGTNPGFYRTIENNVLRKCCIEYLAGHDKIGQKQYSGTDIQTIQPNNTAAMEDYAALVKFMEEAFEWEILSYTFYPFYWANKADWQTAYQQDVDDAIFRAFLQSGMARAVVSVRPGFEEAVMYYMATGKIWLGGQVPIIGDDLYLSIVEELKNQEYYIEETWETRVPTTLTAIQAGSIALNIEGLPCACGDDNGIVQSDATIQGAN